MIKGQ